MGRLNFLTANKVFLVVFAYHLVLFDIVAAQQGNIENKVKAAYLYNFTKFIVWPERVTDVFNVCILGHDPFGGVINPIEKRTVKQRPIRLHRLQSISEITQCHIVYLGLSKIKQAQERSEILLPGILTISSMAENFTDKNAIQLIERAGMIVFFIKDGKVKLHINVQKLRSSGLEISAKLLEVAEVYEGARDD